MSQRILPGPPPVMLTLRRSARARRISLRVSGVDGQVTLTLPHGAAEAEALEFARARQAWLQARLAALPGVVQVRPGADLPLEGRLRRLVPGTGRKIAVTQDSLALPGPADTAGPRLQAWLKARARTRLAAASDRYAARLGRGYDRITLRDTRSRWGSCSSRGGLNYSWRLIMAPPEVLDYVAAHEVAHLAEMNHSRAFWAVVARLMPDHDAPRRWLRAEGADLHRYRFDD